MKIINLINDLRLGGTEKSLVSYCLSDKKNENVIITFGSSAVFKNLLEKNNIKIYVFDLKKSKLSFFFKFRKLIKDLKPDIVNSWMYHSHFLSFISLPNKYPLVWSIRNENITHKNLGFFTYLLVKAISYMSKFKVKAIIYNSNKSKLSHINGGFREDVSHVIYNGYIPQFNKINFENNLNSNIIKIANIGRYHEVKNHDMLFKALKKIKDKNYKFTCTLIGSGMNKQNDNLAHKVIKYDLKENIILRDEIEDMTSEYPRYDFTVLVSKNESFPNVVAESLNHGVPCISTDVGDVRKIIGNTNQVVAVNNLDDLIKKIELYISLIKNRKEEWKILKKSSSKQILNFFTIEQMYKKFNKIFFEIAKSNI